MNTLSEMILDEVRYGWGDSTLETIAHELIVTETNLRGRVALCPCGWQGTVNYPPCRSQGKRKVYDITAAEDAAKKEWAGHLGL